MKAVASFTVNTPLLKVDSFEMTGKGKDASVEFYLTDVNGEKQKITKPIIKKLKVGDDTRPVVSGEFWALVKFANKSLLSTCLIAMKRSVLYSR